MLRKQASEARGGYLTSEAGFPFAIIVFRLQVTSLTERKAWRCSRALRKRRISDSVIR